MREVERRVLLSVLDRRWREHLFEMDYLQEGIGLRAMAQRDPLVEYQREGFMLFEAMMDGIKEESVAYLFNLEVEIGEEEAQRLSDAAEAKAQAKEQARAQFTAKGLEPERHQERLHYSAPGEDGGVEEHDEVAPDSSAGSRKERRAAKRSQRKGR